jgi:hypothetical protein
MNTENWHRASEHKPKPNRKVIVVGDEAEPGNVPGTIVDCAIWTGAAWKSESFTIIVRWWTEMPK